MAEKKYSLKDRVAVIGTGKYAGFPAKEERKVHPRVAEKLIKLGRATKA
jgi:hypothetical protein